MEAYMKYANEYEEYMKDALQVNEKGGDCAGLASHDAFEIVNAEKRDEYFFKVKFGIGYATIAMFRRLSDEKNVQDPDDYKKYEDILQEINDIENYESLKETIKKCCEFRDYLKSLDERI